MATKRSKAARKATTPRAPKPPQHPQTRRGGPERGAGGRRATLLVLGGVAAVIIAAAVTAFVLTRGDDGPTVGAGRVATDADGIPQRGAVLGRASAPVTLVEYADLQCPFCAQFAVDVLPTIIRRYVRPGRVRMEYRGLAFIGEDSREGLAWAFAAGEQDRLWQVTELLFESQGPENSGWVDESLLQDVARSAGLDPERVAAAADSARVTQRIDEDARRAQRDAITATPSFLVGPTGGELRKVTITSLSVDEFATILDEELAAAR